MESKQSRRHFLKTCARSGAACCVLLAWNLPALHEFNKKNQARYLTQPGVVLIENKTKQ